MQNRFPSCESIGVQIFYRPWFIVSVKGATIGPWFPSVMSIKAFIVKLQQINPTNKCVIYYPPNKAIFRLCLNLSFNIHPGNPPGIDVSISSRKFVNDSIAS